MNFAALWQFTTNRFAMTITPVTVLVLTRATDAAEPLAPPAQLLLQATQSAYRHGPPAFDMLALHAFQSQAIALDWQRSAAALGLVALVVQPHTVVNGIPHPNGVCHVELLVRRGGLSPEDFTSYWQKTHGPIAARMPAVRRYQQFTTIETGACSFDGIALLWFDSMDALRENARHPAFTEAREDMARFMDMAQSRSVLTQPRVA